MIGKLYREGARYTQEPIEVFDHNWVSLATGVAIPHGLYDMTDNVGYIQIGTSHDTTEFASDSIRHWWNQYGQRRYSQATSMVLLCDGGGSNSSRYYIFKQDLQVLANELGIEIRIAHYPPYMSKYNPIEHRLFPHVARACQGMIFDTIETIQDLIARTTTRTGLKVFTTILDMPYQTGRKATEDFKATMKIVFDDALPQWNYTAIPEVQVI